MKRNYMIPKMSIAKFDAEDIITTSAVAPVNTLKNEVGGVQIDNGKKIDSQYNTVFE